MTAISNTPADTPREMGRMLLDGLTVDPEQIGQGDPSFGHSGQGIGSGHIVGVGLLSNRAQPTTYVVAKPF